MYKIAGDSIRRLSDGATIPRADGNRDYRAFLAWEAQGNTPEPEFTPDELAAREKAQQEAARLEALKTDTVDLCQIICTMFEKGRSAGLWTDADFPERIPAMATIWRLNLDEIEAQKIKDEALTTREEK